MKFMSIPVVIAIVFSILPNLLLANNPGKDFLITLNGSKLTGIIKNISSTKNKTQISFENDFGDTYIVDAATIFGFAFEEKGEMAIYESKYLDGEWQFLKVEEKGYALSLYTSSERQLQYSTSGESPTVVKEKNPQIWLQFEGEQPFKVYQLNYKAVLRKKMESYPDLAERIGKRGFKYKDIPKIVDLFNRFQTNGQ